MHSFYVDASALAKRFVPEQGSLLIDEILDKVPGERLYILNVVAGEVVSILVRKRNVGVISDPYLRQALVDFENEIVRSADINKLGISNRLATSSFALIVAHSINSTDAVTLKSALAIDKKLRAAGNGLVVVASDQRLLRAAQAEGLTTFNPETQDSNSVGGSHEAIEGIRDGGTNRGARVMQRRTFLGPALAVAYASLT